MYQASFSAYSRTEGRRLSAALQFIIHSSLLVIVPSNAPAFAKTLTYPSTGLAESVSSQDSHPEMLARTSDLVNSYSSSASTVAQASICDSTESALITKFMTVILEANIYLCDVKAMQCFIRAIASQLNASSAVVGWDHEAAKDARTEETSLLQGKKFEVSRQSFAERHRYERAI